VKYTELSEEECLGAIKQRIKTVEQSLFVIEMEQQEVAEIYKLEADVSAKEVVKAKQEELREQVKAHCARLRALKKMLESYAETDVSDEAKAEVQPS
jgi:hypothetical protein